jgi:hypothetical protein
MNKNVRNILEAVTKTMCEVISRVYLPLVVRAVMRTIKDTVSGKVPHLGVGVAQILFHAKVGFLWSILPILHVLKFKK